jgi:hypothetical protein
MHPGGQVGSSIEGRAGNEPSRARLGSAISRAEEPSSARLEGGSRAVSAREPHPDII